VAVGSAANPARISSGATADVTVPLSEAMPSASYIALAGLSGGSIASAVVLGIVSRTATSVTVRVKASAVINAGAATVEVMASAG
jgi:hypothetical protein